MSFFQEKIFLTKKNIFRPGANALQKLVKKGIQRKNKAFFLEDGAVSCVVLCQVVSIKKTRQYHPLTDLDDNNNNSVFPLNATKKEPPLHPRSSRGNTVIQDLSVNFLFCLASLIHCALGI